MAQPSLEELLTAEELRQYKKLQVLDREAADEYALSKAKTNVGRIETELKEGKEPSISVPAFAAPKTPVAPEPTYDVGVPTEVTTEEEMGLTFESPFFETERERLEREARRPVEEDFIYDGDIFVGAKPVAEDVGLPEQEKIRIIPERQRLEEEAAAPVTEEENVRIRPDVGLPEEELPRVFIPVTPERAKEAPERVRAVTPTEEGPPSVAEASRLQKIYSKFDAAEKAAYQKAKRELIQQGASLYEAEARAAQIVRGAISGPREILTAERIAAESPELTEDFRVSPEFYQSEDVSIFEKVGEAFRPKPLKSPREIAIEQASKARGEETRALIEEEVTQDLVAWRNGTKKFKGESYYTFFKDPVAGGVDQDKVEAWKKERFAELVRRTQSDIKATVKRDLLDAEAAKGNPLKPSDPAYKDIDTTAEQISTIWASDTAPEIITPDESGLLDLALRTDTKLKWNSKDFSFDIVKEGRGAPAFETPLAAGLRSVGGAIRGVTEPIAEFMTYDVNDKGDVLDKSDWNYGIHASMQYAWDKIEKGTATPLDYAVAYNPFGAIASTGRTIEGSAPLLSEKKFAGIPASLGLTDGTGYFEDWAFATATGRWLGADIAEAPVIKEYYDSRGMSYVPWLAGLAGELLLPVSSLTAVGRGVGTAGRLGEVSGRAAITTGGVGGVALGSLAGPAGAAVGGLLGAGAGAGVAGVGRLAARLPRVGEAIGEAGRFIEKPLRTTASAVGNRVGSIRLYNELLKASGAPPLSVGDTLEFFFKPARLNEVAAEGVSSVIANNVARNVEFPRGVDFPEFNNLVYKAKGLDAVYDAFIKTVNGEEAKITIPEGQRPVLSEIVSNRIAYYLLEEGGLGRIIGEEATAFAGETGVSSRRIIDKVRNEIKKSIDGLISGKKIELKDVDRGLNEVIRSRLTDSVKPSLIASDIVPDVERLFAETTFNDWLLITPTTIVRTGAWEKYGKQIDAATKKILFGDFTDNEITKVLVDNDKVLLLNKDEVITALENYKLRTGKTPTYINNLIKVVRESAFIPVDDFNKIADIVKSEQAAKIIPKGLGRAVDVVATGRVTERAATPLVRRATVTRAIETLERGLVGRVLSKGSKQYQSQTIFGLPFKGLAGKVPRANVELVNRVNELSARINDLPAEVSTQWRKAIAEGASPNAVLQDEIDKTFNVGKVSKEQFVEDLSNIVKRFFTITDEAKLFKESYGVVINRIVDTLAENGVFGTKLADETYDYKMSFEVVKDVLSKVQSRFAPLADKGLDSRVTGYFRKSLDDEGILSLMVAQSLDKRRLAIIDEFGQELAKNYPELVVGNRESFIDNVYSLENEITSMADVSDEVIGRLTREARELGIKEDDLIGQPTIVREADDTNVIVREYINNQDTWNQDLMGLASPKIISDVLLTINKSTFDQVVADVYQKVIRNVSVEGSINMEQLQTRITEAFLERINLQSATDRIKKALREDPTLSKIDFTDSGRLAQKEMGFKKLPTDRQDEILSEIIADPTKYTDDVDTIAKLNEYNAIVGKAEDLDFINAEINKVMPLYTDFVTLDEAAIKKIKVPKNAKWITNDLVALKVSIDNAVDKATGLIPEEKFVDLQKQFMEVKGKIGRWVIKERLAPDIAAAATKREALARRVANANVWNDEVIIKTGLFNQELEAGIRNLYLKQIQQIVNVNAVDVIGKLQATGIPMNVVGGDITFSDVMIRAKQIGPVSALIDNDTYLILDQLTSNNIYVERGLEGLASKNKGLASWLGQSLVNVIDYVNLRTIQGMLGGYIAPTTRFFGVNNWSALLIAAVTNPTYIGTVAKQILPATVMAPLTAARAVGPTRVGAGAALTGATLGAVAGGPVGALIGAPVGLGAGYITSKLATSGVDYIISKLATSKATYGFSDVAPILTPSGKVITNTEFNSILGRNKWRMSQIDFEFSDRLLSETVDALRGRTRGDVWRMTAAHLTTISRDRNWFNAIGSEADIVFRRGVFKEALARGLPEGQAANLARNTLLDYTAVTEAERKTISRAILFYSFARQSLLETMMAFMREPTENAVIRKVLFQRAMADRVAKEYGIELEDYQRSRLWINVSTSGVEYDEKDVAFFGIDDPMLSQFNSMLGTFGLVNAYDYTDKSRADMTKALVDWYAGKRPELAFLQDIYEISAAGKDGYLGMVPATELVAMQETGYLESAVTRYDLQPIPQIEIDKLTEKYGGLPAYLAGKPTYNGQYWQFGSEEGKVKFFTHKYLSTIAGFQRGITDWAQMSIKTSNVKNPELKRYKDGKWYLYGQGLETPMEAPDWLQIQYEIAQAQYRDLQKVKEGKGIKRVTTEGE